MTLENNYKFIHGGTEINTITILKIINQQEYSLSVYFSYNMNLLYIILLMLIPNQTVGAHEMVKSHSQ